MSIHNNLRRLETVHITSRRNFFGYPVPALVDIDNTGANQKLHILIDIVLYVKSPKECCDSYDILPLTELDSVCAFLALSKSNYDRTIFMQTPQSIVVVVVLIN